MSRSSADTVIHLFIEIVNCGEHLEDIVSSYSWWAPEIGESYGFTLLFILSYLGNPEDVWELWLIRAVNFHFSGYIYYGSYFRCCVVGCRNQERRCSTRGVCGLTPATHTLASIIFTHTKGRDLRKNIWYLFHKACTRGEHARNNNDAISFPILIFQKETVQILNWKLTFLSLPKMGMKQGYYLINKCVSWISRFQNVLFFSKISKMITVEITNFQSLPLKLISFPAGHFRCWWLYLMDINPKDADMSVFVHGRVCLWCKTYSCMVTFVLVIIYTDLIRILQLPATSSTVAIQNLWMVPTIRSPDWNMIHQLY